MILFYNKNCKMARGKITMLFLEHGFQKCWDFYTENHINSLSMKNFLTHIKWLCVLFRPPSDTPPELIYSDMQHSVKINRKTAKIVRDILKEFSKFKIYTANTYETPWEYGYYWKQIVDVSFFDKEIERYESIKESLDGDLNTLFSQMNLE